MREEAILKELTALWGVAGYEKEVRHYLEKLAAPYADEMLTDAIGNLIVKKKGTGGPQSKKIMYAAHMVEEDHVCGAYGRDRIYGEDH